ncbi:MAG: 1-acyl-sn-glycerol-3-phosphate acyltransferase [Myxococcales bacterium]|nr:1-acyl-sn-glycerol-3-phosphate acyltransferase [Myxococcales bacterium]
MLTLDTLKRVRLTRYPWGQRFVGNFLLGPNLKWFPGAEVIFEDDHLIPEGPVLFTMNHTDHYNYWPFQYELWQRYNRFTATWAKAKYYEGRFAGKFLELTGNIPTVSRGFIIAKDFLEVVGRRPTDEEYGHLRDWLNAIGEDGQVPPPPFGADDIPPEILQTPRNMLGRPFDPSRESYAEAADHLFHAMMEAFRVLNQQALDVGLDLLIFPQGTRSKRLSRGHIGAAQIALRFKLPVVPIGCNGSDVLYPGGNPFATKGRVVYRFGKPLTYADFKEFHVGEDFLPFSRRAELQYRDRFQGTVDIIMDRINELLDPPYQFAEGGQSDGVKGAERFV